MQEKKKVLNSKVVQRHKLVSSQTPNQNPAEKVHMRWFPQTTTPHHVQPSLPASSTDRSSRSPRPKPQTRPELPTNLPSKCPHHVPKLIGSPFSVYLHSSALFRTTQGEVFGSFVAFGETNSKELIFDAPEVFKGTDVDGTGYSGVVVKVVRDICQAFVDGGGTRPRHFEEFESMDVWWLRCGALFESRLLRMCLCLCRCETQTVACPGSTQGSGCVLPRFSC